MKGTPLEKPCQYRGTADGGPLPKPCPFCGGAVALDDWLFYDPDVSGDLRFGIGCNNERCGRPVMYGRTAAAVLKKWNRRASIVKEWLKGAKP